MNYSPVPSPHPRKENVANTRKRLLENKNGTFPVVHYFTWKLEFFSNIFPVVVNGITSTCVKNNQKQSRFHKFLSIELFPYSFPLIFPKIWHAFMNKNSLKRQHIPWNPAVNALSAGILQMSKVHLMDY